jgi:hypothetical protein
MAVGPVDMLVSLLGIALLGVLVVAARSLALRQSELFTRAYQAPTDSPFPIQLDWRPTSGGYPAPGLWVAHLPHRTVGSLLLEADGWFVATLSARGLLGCSEAARAETRGRWSVKGNVLLLQRDFPETGPVSVGRPLEIGPGVEQGFSLRTAGGCVTFKRAAGTSPGGICRNFNDYLA